MEKGYVNLLLIPFTVSLLIMVKALQIQDYRLAIATTVIGSLCLFVYVRINSKLDKEEN